MDIDNILSTKKVIFYDRNIYIWRSFVIFILFVRLFSGNAISQDLVVY